MARCILMTGGGGGVMSEDTTVTKGNILANKTYLGSDTDDEIGVGTMPNRGTVSSNLNCGQSYAIPDGYHTGSGKITANSLSSQTSGNATAATTLKGKTVWVNGSKITGTMANVSATEKMKSCAISGSNLYVRMSNGAHITNASNGYPEIYVPQSTIASTYGLTADKIAKGQSVMGISGTNIGGNSVAKTTIIYDNGKFGSGFSLSNLKKTSDSDSITVENNYIKYMKDPDSYSDGFIINKYLTFDSYSKIKMKFRAPLTHSKYYPYEPETSFEFVFGSKPVSGSITCPSQHYWFNTTGGYNTLHEITLDISDIRGIIRLRISDIEPSQLRIEQLILTN